MQKEWPRRRSPRLRGFDYSHAGAYFVTICAHNKRCLFGEIEAFQMKPNSLGEIVTDCWMQFASDYTFVSLDAWTLMPNHMHGIIWLGSENPSHKSLSRIIAAFKAMSTSRARQILDPQIILWQRGFFEHIIRDDSDLYRIREYVDLNAVNWAVDRENPSCSAVSAETFLAAGACNAPLQRSTD
jgi:putative transposase